MAVKKKIGRNIDIDIYVCIRIHFTFVMHTKFCFILLFFSSILFYFTFIYRVS